MKPLKIVLLEDDSYNSSLKKKIKSTFSLQKSLNDQTEIIVCKLAYYLGEELLEKAKSLRYIISPTTGLGHIDMNYCKSKNIKVLSLKDVLDQINNVRSTSELTLFLILGLIRNVFLAEASWELIGPKNRMNYRGRELSKMSVGIVGLGRIGSHLMGYLESLKAKVFYYDNNPIKQAYNKKISCINLQELISKSDVISINADLNQQSYQMFSQKEFSLMKNKYLVNTARAEIIDKKYLIQAIKNSTLLGYATDVYWDEQSINNYDSSLMDLKRKGKNIILTPHLGGCTVDAMDTTEKLMFDLLDKVSK